MDRFLARSGVAIAMGSLAVATVTGVSAIYWGIAVGLALLFAGEFG